LAFQADPSEPELPITVYRTGDLLRVTPGGLHYYIGRKDTQVKVRGHRVELGEIERSLLKHEKVLEATVVYNKRDEEDDCLVAFIRAEREMTPDRVIDYLRDWLPPYMIPSLVICLSSEMPRNENGKIDRQALIRLAFKSPSERKKEVSSDAFRSRVRTAIAEALRINPSELPLRATADTVERWDSLGHLAIIDVISRRFEVDIDHAEAVRLLDEDTLIQILVKTSLGNDNSPSNHK